MTLRITNVDNANDNSHVTVTLSGAPSGALSFKSSPTPEPLDTNPVGGEACTYVAGAGNTYTVAIPAPPILGEYIPYRLIYLKALDDAGASPKVAVWIGLVDVGQISETMTALRDRIYANKLGIEARLAGRVPGCTLKQVIYGTFEKIEHFPCIEIVQTQKTQTYYASDFYRLNTLGADISGYIYVQNSEYPHDQLSAEFGEAVQTILNQRGYETMRLPSGLVLTSCQAQNLRFDTTWTGQVWAASWSMGWSAEYGGAIP